MQDPMLTFYVLIYGQITIGTYSKYCVRVVILVPLIKMRQTYKALHVVQMNCHELPWAQVTSESLLGTTEVGTAAESSSFQFSALFNGGVTVLKEAVRPTGVDCPLTQRCL